jgi:hypothetical protein
MSIKSDIEIDFSNNTVLNIIISILVFIFLFLLYILISKNKINDSIVKDIENSLNINNKQYQVMEELFKNPENSYVYSFRMYSPRCKESLNSIDRIYKSSDSIFTLIQKEKSKQVINRLVVDFYKYLHSIIELNKTNHNWRFSEVYIDKSKKRCEKINLQFNNNKTGFDISKKILLDRLKNEELESINELLGDLGHTDFHCFWGNTFIETPNQTMFLNDTFKQKFYFGDYDSKSNNYGVIGDSKIKMIDGVMSYKEKSSVVGKHQVNGYLKLKNNGEESKTEFQTHYYVFPNESVIYHDRMEELYVNQSNKLKILTSMFDNPKSIKVKISKGRLNRVNKDDYIAQFDESMVGQTISIKIMTKEGIIKGERNFILLK